jgi:cell division protease FtsH
VLGGPDAEKKMQRLGRTLNNVLPVLLVVVGLGIAAIGIVGLPGVGPAADTDTNITYAETWTFSELISHADAGEVLAVSVPSAADRSSRTGTGAAAAGTTVAQAAPPKLSARTMDGRWARVQLPQTSDQAVDALRSLGYGRLLSGSSVADATPILGSGQLSGLLMMAAAAFVVVGSLMFLVRRTKGLGEESKSGDSNTFQTLAPAAPSRSPSESVVPAPVEGSPAVAPITFDDVAGCDEAKGELLEVIDFLSSPERYRRLGARIPRGVLFYGPPGNGKTLLARAVAVQAGVAFTAASGSDFVEKYVGVGAQRVRDLFRQARGAGKGVIFIDEIDALAKSRSSGGMNNQEADQTLNALLTEMDGFNTTDTVVVLAATNRIDTLDPAILRPGRFGRKIHVSQPDLEARRAILAVHAKDKPLADDVVLDTLARRTGGFSGAMLADLLNEAAIFAARRDADEITLNDVEQGWTKVAVGIGRKRSMPLRERAIIAAHEAGHAICGRIHADSRTVERISMFRHGDALGYTLTSEGDELLPSEAQLRGQLVALMGGRAAEALLFVDHTGGASNDFEKANQLADAMVTKWGLGADPETAGGITGRGALGYLVGGEGGTIRGPAEAAATRAIASILDHAYETALDTLRANLDLLERVAAYLVETEEMTGEEFAAICEGRLEPSAEALATWLVAEAQPRERSAIYAGEVTRAALRVPSDRVAAVVAAPAVARVVAEESLAPAGAVGTAALEAPNGRRPVHRLRSAIAARGRGVASIMRRRRTRRPNDEVVAL